MAKKAAPTQTSDTEPAASQYLYAITTDLLVNPSSDTPLSGELTRSELEEAGVDVDGLLARGILEETNHVRQAG